MAASNSRRRRQRAQTEDIEEHLAPLARAMPEPPTGRVRSLEEARRALRIPTSSDPGVLQLWGVPADFQLVAYPVTDPDQHSRVVEFAILRVVTRRKHELVPRERHSRLRLAQLSNALWIVYGAIATATDGSLILEAVTIAPAFHDQPNRESGDIARGVTSQLLRLISPPRILAACAEQLLIHRYWLERPPEGAKPMSDTQRELLGRIDQGRPQRARVSDDQLAAFAARYLTLYHRGAHQLRDQLAHEFGLTTIQVRDRTHQARRRGYLTPGSRGRVGADPGPRLLERGWRPELPQSLLPIERTDKKPSGKTSVE